MELPSLPCFKINIHSFPLPLLVYFLFYLLFLLPLLAYCCQHHQWPLLFSKSLKVVLSDRAQYQGKLLTEKPSDGCCVQNVVFKADRSGTNSQLCDFGKWPNPFQPWSMVVFFFPNRGNHVLIRCHGIKWKTVSKSVAVSSKVLLTLVLCPPYLFSPLFFPQHFLLPLLPNPTFQPHRRVFGYLKMPCSFWCWACLEYYQSSLDVAKFSSSFKSNGNVGISKILSLLLIQSHPTYGWGTGLPSTLCFLSNSSHMILYLSNQLTEPWVFPRQSLCLLSRYSYVKSSIRCAADIL